MGELSYIQLKFSSLLQVPLHSYERDFSFIVNGKEFKTNRIVSDLISPKISKNHSVDATFDTFTINTRNHGDFSIILNLINFQQIELPENQLPFISEVFEILGCELIDIIEPNRSTKLTFGNIFKQIQFHSKYGNFYLKSLTEEIDFISSNFHSLYETNIEELENLDINILDFIINNDKLRIENEDQLLDFINILYEKDEKNSFLYEYVIFTNVSAKSLKTFYDIFDLNDINQHIWKNLGDRFISNNFSDNDYDIKIFEYISGTYKNDVTSLALVTNIPYSATAKDIGDFFNQQFGDIRDARILTESYFNKMYSIGIGLIEFKNTKSLQNAVMKKNIEFTSPYDSETRILNITQARKNNKYDTAVINGIPDNIKEEDIMKAFKQKKPIQVKIVNKRHYITAYAKFSSPNDLNIAIQYNISIVLNNSTNDVSMSRINFKDI